MNTATLTTTAPADVLTEKPRISSIDLVRGIVMVIMALDHARDFFHLGATAYNPTDLNTTTPAIFFTRWITHFCAPTFVFLAGTSIYISAQKKSKNDMSVFLLSRGFWLIVLELVVVRFAIIFNFYYDIIFFQVIWVIGASMICMALLTRISDKAALAIGCIIVAGHNALDFVQVAPTDRIFPLYALLRQSGFFSLTASNNVFVIYPLFPWLGIMILGYGLGKLYVNFDSNARRKMLFRLGAGAIGLFLVLRFINVYGDPAPWKAQKDALFTFISFLNVTKYPVSLQYTLVMLGPVLLILGWMEKKSLALLKPFLVFGRVPLFYYVLHFMLIHAIAVALYLNKSGQSFSQLDFHFAKSFGGITPDAGYSLFITYVLWLAVVIALYPLCKWYNRYKSTHSHWWLSYV